MVIYSRSGTAEAIRECEEDKRVIDEEQADVKERDKEGVRLGWFSKVPIRYSSGGKKSL